MAEKSPGAIYPDLEGKSVLVTGGGSGIGAAIVRAFVRQQAKVGFIDFAEAPSRALVEELGAKAPTLRFAKADIRDIASLRRIADQVDAAYGKIDIVVANAAIQGWKPLMEMGDNDWCDQIENNLNGTANTVRAFGPKMVARKKGRFILLASMQGRMGTKDGAAYSASKWGILGLMKSAALELGAYNITVNAILPGLVGTALTYNEQRFRAAIAQSNRPSPPYPTAQETWDARAPTVPLQVGWLQPEDISPVAVFLASDAAALVTGAEFAATGGDAAKVS